MGSCPLFYASAKMIPTEICVIDFEIKIAARNYLLKTLLCMS